MAHPCSTPVFPGLPRILDLAGQHLENVHLLTNGTRATEENAAVTAHVGASVDHFLRSLTTGRDAIREASLTPLIVVIARTVVPRITRCAFASDSVFVDSDGGAFICPFQTGHRLGPVHDPVPTLAQRRTQADERIQPSSCAALVAIVDFFLGATSVVHMRQAGVNPATIGTLLAIAGLLSFALEIPSGAFADRLGNKRVLVLGQLTWGAAQSFFGWATNTAGVAVSLTVLNIGLALYSGTPISYVTNALGRADAVDQRPRFVRTGTTWRWIGAGIGGALVFVGGERLGVGTALIVSGALLVLGAMWVATRWHPEPSATEAHRPAAHHLAESMSISVAFLRSAAGARLSLAYGGLGFGQGLLVLVWQPRLTDSSLVATSPLGLVLVGLMLGAAVGSAASRLFEARPRGATSAALTVLAVGLAVAMIDGTVSLVGFVIAEVGIGAAGAIVTAHGQSLFDDARRNTLTSITAAVMTAVVAVTQFATGLIWERWGLICAIGTGAAAVLLVAVCCGLWPSVPPQASGSTHSGEQELIS